MRDEFIEDIHRNGELPRQILVLTAQVIAIEAIEVREKVTLI